MGPNGKAWLQLRKGGKRELSVKRTADTDESLKYNEVLKARYNFQNIQFKKKNVLLIIMRMFIPHDPFVILQGIYLK